MATGGAVSRRLMLAAGPMTFVASRSRAAEATPIKIGVLNDQSGVRVIHRQRVGVEVPFQCQLTLWPLVVGVRD